MCFHLRHDIINYFLFYSVAWPVRLPSRVLTRVIISDMVTRCLEQSLCVLLWVRSQHVSSSARHILHSNVRNRHVSSPFLQREKQMQMQRLHVKRAFGRIKSLCRICRVRLMKDSGTERMFAELCVWLVVFTFTNPQPNLGPNDAQECRTALHQTRSPSLWPAL